jgi:hypothetical protein
VVDDLVVEVLPEAEADDQPERDEEEEPEQDRGGREAAEAGEEGGGPAAGAPLGVGRCRYSG